MGVLDVLETRYASKEMAKIFSNENRHRVWRDLWIALAEAEKELGLNITDEQIEDMKKHREDIDYDRIKEIEKLTRHDVMAHIKAFGEKAQKAKGIIHLGATSAFITDNADIVLIKQAVDLIRKRLVRAMSALREFASFYSDLTVLGFTHLQPAQPTTLGKRASMWLFDLVIDYENISYVKRKLRLRGIKGTTGTQASFLKLLGSGEKVRKLEELFSKKMGFREPPMPITGQTYSRKIDHITVSALGMIGATTHRIANDIRILQSFGEIEEPFLETQIGSSAMPYKRNPILSERMTSLARHLMVLPQTMAFNYASQMLERTLDDSANRRIVIPEAFLLTDSVLILLHRITAGLKVYPSVIKKNLKNNIGFFAVENILMEGVKQGGDRQKLHEVIRKKAMEVRERRQQGEEAELIEKLKESPEFSAIPESFWEEVEKIEQYSGRAKEQVEEFLREVIDPIIESNPDAFEVEVPDKGV